MLPILFVIFQTGSSANGGVESITQVIEHSPHLRPMVITQIETPVNQRWAATGAEVQVWPIPYRIGSAFQGGTLWQRWRRLWSLVSTNLRMAWLVWKRGYRVVHHNDPSAFWHTALGAKLAGAKVVFNIRDTKAPDDHYGLKWQGAERLCDRILVLSAAMGESLLTRWRATQRQPNKVQAIYSIVDSAQLHPLDPEQRAQQRQALGIPPNTFALGYVAGLNPKKAQLAFIEQAVPALRQRLPNLRIYFLGDCDPDRNPYAAQCIAAAQRLGLGKSVIFVGYTPAIAAWYPALDLVTIASRQEGLARCMIESLACGTPVVSFEVCSAAEILHGHNCGLVAPQGNYPALVEAIATLATHPDQRHHLGQNGLKATQTLFEPAAIAAQYETFYRSLTQAPTSQDSTTPSPSTSKSLKNLPNPQPLTPNS